ncbi:RNase H domain-containing protein [Trichonephila clavipes]|nr:RNase H domain-containing protein [Trichonephila clavipes]
MPDHPELLKQSTLEMIDGIPLDAVKIYTDGSLPGNEIADNLAKGAASDNADPENHMVLTLTKIYSRAKELIRRTLVVHPVHSWYFERDPGSAISFKGSRSYQTTFS